MLEQKFRRLIVIFRLLKRTFLHLNIKTDRNLTSPLTSEQVLKYIPFGNSNYTILIKQIPKNPPTGLPSLVADPPRDPPPFGHCLSYKKLGARGQQVDLCRWGESRLCSPASRSPTTLCKCLLGSVALFGSASARSIFASPRDFCGLPWCVDCPCFFLF